MSRNPSIFGFACVMCMMFFIAGCQPDDGSRGVHVYFESTPTLYQSDVYWYGKVVGKIVDQVVGRGSVTRITLALEPQFKARIGTHWAFYADQGRLSAGRLSPAGDALVAGDKICGFTSKAAFNWFKFKTLLNDRVGKAVRRAGQLHLRFG